MNELHTGEGSRALTPVIGIVLLLAMTVLLAATTAAFVSGTDDRDGDRRSAVPSVTASVDADLQSGPDAVRFVHESGDAIDPRRLDVAITGAACDGQTVNGRYNALTDFGMVADFTAGRTLAVGEGAPAGPCPDGALALDGSTIRVVWTSPAAGSSVVRTWTGPDA